MDPMEFPVSSGARPPDRVLVASMRDPGSDALVVLLRRHADAVHDYISATVSSPAVAEDVFMRVFVRAWTELNVRRMPGESALPWMLAVAGEAAAESRRGHEKSAAPADAAKPFAAQDPEAVLAGRSGALQAAMERLSPRERRIIELTLAHGYSYRHAVRQTRPRGEGGLRAFLRLRGGTRGAVAILRGNANG